ncbi:transposase [Neoroseomonas oryzicola]|uniref:transposase n=1 Tax=Neoroseomonas oryzicola TaxID=535904 RepID=UPI001ADF8699
MEERLRELYPKNDDLERIAALVNFAILRAALEWAAPRADGAQGDRPSFDHVLMFKMLLLHARHGLSDERCEYVIKDRLSFMRFLGLGAGRPDARRDRRAGRAGEAGRTRSASARTRKLGGRGAAGSSSPPPTWPRSTHSRSPPGRGT